MILFLKERTKLFIRLSSGTTYWGKKNKRRIWFSKTFLEASLKTAMNNLIKNCYYNVGNVTKKQGIGIPMGTILTQHHFGQTFFYIPMKKNPCHFQDIQDTSKTFPLNKALHWLSLCYDGGEFGRPIVDIYPKELELKVEHQGDHVTFFNLDLIIKERTFTYKLFGKRDSFPFSIVRISHIESNIPHNVFYSVIKGEFSKIGFSYLKLKSY